jgi:hypothetical protein
MGNALGVKKEEEEGDQMEEDDDGNFRKNSQFKGSC